MSPHIDEVRFDPSLLADARRRANAARGRLLKDVADGRMSAWEAIILAALDDRPALRRIQLEQLVMTQPGIGKARATKVVRQILAILAVPTESANTKEVTIGYVLDARCGGRRMLATIESFLSHGIIQTSDEIAVWSGFPYSPSPSAHRKER